MMFFEKKMTPKTWKKHIQISMKNVGAILKLATQSYCPLYLYL